MKTPSYRILIALMLAPLALQADDPRPIRKASVPPLRSSETAKDYDLSLETGAGFLVSDVRTNNKGYTLVPAEMTLSLKLDDVSLDDELGGILRGNTEFVFRAFGMAVKEGIEERFVGMQYGPRYNFVQPGWDIVPFIEGNVGFGFTDSRGYVDPVKGQQGQGQDFCFNFGIGLGFRYDISPSWFMRVAGNYTHFSNGGLSEPGRKNRALDAAGPQLTFGYRF
ncbi:MAG: acyloxyacyl hydrolase [Verrucomicrobiae bacterium]|nr:acyloxyacyl hydrolase [Verrucomicrobiae bacterium]